MPIHKKIIIANENAAPPFDGAGISTDQVQPFMLDVSQLRGRIVRLPNVIDAILKAHDYPAPVARLLGEALCLTTLLAGMLKFDGIFTLQVKGEGPLSLLVCDITTAGVLRGYASFDKDAVAALGDDADFLTLTVRGYLAFTVDQAGSTDRYQGITELSGATLTAAVQHYFKQSEQIQTAFVTQIDKNEEHWNVAAIMIQQLGLEGGTSDKIEASDVTENWRRTMMLLQTIKEGELLDQDSALNEILFKLFHEESVRVFAPIVVTKGCRCSIEKIRSVLEGLPSNEVKDLAIDGKVTVTCEFCNTTYEFPIEELTK
jgi:molecular chaperone Hsp33